MVAGSDGGADGARVTTFWQTNQVGGPYATPYDSEQALEAREALYPDLYDLMPVDYPGQSILDYGCGPGHDTILFLRHHARKVWYADVSWQALQTTSDRLQMHGLGKRAQAILLPESLPLVDHIHCAGVLHHCEDPEAILAEFRKILVNGDARVMIYDGDVSDHTQSEVPITHWWTRTQFRRMAYEAGFTPHYLGSYECSAEWRPNCYAACFSLT